MKFQASVLALLAFGFGEVTASDQSGEECTHGKLFLMDNTTSKVYVIDVHAGVQANMAIETEIAMPSEGAGNLTVYGNPADPLVIQYRGEEPDFDGFVRVVDTGFSFDDHGDHGHVQYEEPSIVSNALIDDCHRPIHEVRHDEKIAIFCDGAFDADPPQNTTIHVVDKTLIGSTTESAVAYSTTLQGAHHGVAVPVDDGHLLHSLASPARILRDPNVSSLPDTFQVVNMEGIVLHEMTDTSNRNTHCSGFHGSAFYENKFYLACDDVHGGIVVVDYDPSTETYTSQAVTYPASFEGFRVGSFAYHKKAPAVVGSFAAQGGTEFHLLGLSLGATSFEEKNILTLPGELRQCGYMYEVGSGEHLLVFMPDGVLHVFKVSNAGSFTTVMSKEIVPGLTACSEAAFVAGIGQAFVATPETKTLYAIDLTHVEDKEMDVYTTSLPFFPSGMTVSGFSVEAACELHSYGDEHGGSSPNGTSASFSVSTAVAVFASVLVAVAI